MPSDLKRSSDARGWWESLPAETYWLEITGRTDIGANLKAPQLDQHGEPYWSYTLIDRVRPGDVVLHYDTKERAIVGYSRASGSYREQDITWAARGTSSRKRHVPARPQPGLYLDLEGFAALPSPLHLRELAEAKERMWAVRNSLRMQYGDPLRFPFVAYENNKTVRAFQGYLTKFPRDLLRVFPKLSPVLTPTNSIVNAPEPALASPFGAPYKAANELRAVAKADPFEFDPAIVERGLWGHSKTQNDLADWVKARHAKPQSSLGNDLNFDLAWESGGRIFVAEVKSLTDANEDKQLRLGLGQVLHYRHLLERTSKRNVIPVLAVERPVRDASWATLCASVGVLLVWPPRFGGLEAELDSTTP